MSTPSADDGTTNSNPLAHQADRELEEMLRDAELAVRALRAELDIRRQWREGNNVPLADKHAEVAKLAEHLENAKVHWPAVREFFHEAMLELQRENSSRTKDGESR
ncbi:MAG: hypothetical protein Q4G43_02040 [Mobilicoccus sp.]|nr:hypothetical protein [Mobilicoccus sp.]